MQRSLPRLDFILILLVLVLSMGGLYYNLNIKQAPGKVYYAALEDGLTTKAVACHVIRTTDTVTNDQTIKLKLAGMKGAHTTTMLKRAKSTVKTEEVALPKTSYVRYISIQSNQKDAAGKTLNFDSIVGTWGKTEAGANSYSETVQGNCTVPLAGLTVAQVAPLMNELRQNKIFKTDISKSKLATYQGRRVRVYDVMVQPEPYVNFLQKVGKLTNIHDLDTINASAYAKRTAAHISMIVDGNKAEVMKINYLDSNQTITFSRYDEPTTLATPKTSIPSAELEQKLAQIK